MNVLRIARLEKDMTIEQLAEASGVAAGTISNLENAVNKARPLTIARLARALGKNIDDFQELIMQKEDNVRPKNQATLAATDETVQAA